MEEHVGIWNQIRTMVMYRYDDKPSIQFLNQVVAVCIKNTDEVSED